jgi:hypothetical protein
MVICGKYAAAMSKFAIREWIANGESGTTGVHAAQAVVVGRLCDIDLLSRLPGDKVNCVMLKILLRSQHATLKVVISPLIASSGSGVNGVIVPAAAMGSAKEIDPLKFIQIKVGKHVETTTQLL